MTSRAVHFDIPIDDPDRASAFYHSVFDWEVTRWGPMDYWTISAGEPGPGAEGALSARADAPEGVVIYIAVDDVDAALARVTQAGGTPVTEKQPIPTFGWMARFRDSEGNLIGLFQEDPAVEMTAG